MFELILIMIHKREKNMRNRSQASSTARKKQLKVQHHKVNSRRQFFFNQVVQHVSELQSKES